MSATLTVIGLYVGWLLGGTVLVETVFDWPGLGLYATKAIVTQDFMPVIGVTLVIGVIYRRRQSRSSTCSTASSIRRCATNDARSRAQHPAPRPRRASENWRRGFYRFRQSWLSVDRPR